MALGRPTEKRRLHTLDPDLIALEITQQAFEKVTSQVGQLFDPTFTVVSRTGILGYAALRETHLWKSVAEIARYARYGKPVLPKPIEFYMELLATLYTSVYGTGRTAEDMIEPEPITPIGTIVMAARCRDGIAKKRVLTSSEVTALLGIDRNYITLMAARGEVPGAFRDEKDTRRPWYYRPNKHFQEWLYERLGERVEQVA